jgi:hypothetical protein
VAVCSCDAGDEVEYREGATDRKVLVESVERSLTLEPSIEESDEQSGSELSIALAVGDNRLRGNSTEGTMTLLSPGL